MFKGRGWYKKVTDNNVTVDEVAKRLQQNFTIYRNHLEKEFRKDVSVLVANIILDDRKVEIMWKEKGGWRFPQKISKTKEAFSEKDYFTLALFMDEPMDILESKNARDREVLTIGDKVYICARTVIDLTIHVTLATWFKNKEEELAALLLMLCLHPEIKPEMDAEEFEKIVNSNAFLESKIAENLFRLEGFRFLEEITSNLMQVASRWNTTEIFEEGKKNLMEDMRERKGVAIDIEECIRLPLRKEYKHSYNKEFPEKYLERGDPEWIELEALLSEYHPWDLGLLTNNLNASNKIKKWMSDGGLDKKGNKPICRVSLAEKHYLEKIVDKKRLKSIPPEMQDLLLELESQCYSNSILALSQEDIVIELHRKGPIVLYGSVPWEKSLFCQDMLKLSSFVLIQNSSLDAIGMHIKRPYQETKGYLVENTSDGFRWKEQKPHELEQYITTRSEINKSSLE
jgi:hypothetical protein